MEEFTAEQTILSYPKSGRTWLSYLITGYIARYLGKPAVADPVRNGRLATRRPEGHAKYVRLILERRTPGRWAPLVSFTHRDGLDRPFYDMPPRRLDDIDRIFVLVRDPRDVVVSLFHHVMRKNGGYVARQGGPRLPDDYGLDEFIRSDRFGFRHLMAYHARWGEVVAEHGRPVFYFEDFVARPREALTALLRALGVSEVAEPFLSGAIEAASFDRLSAAERMNANGDDASRRRLRRGRVGGYADELAPPDIEFCTRLMEKADLPLLRRYL